MSLKAIDLFQAYNQGKLPEEGGYIVSSFFHTRSKYTRYEIVAYEGVKTIYLTEEGLTFQTDGSKLFILVEPPSYPQKAIEPFRRSTEEQIPHRFSELNVFIAKNQTRVMVSKEPLITYSSFSILKPTLNNFAILFYTLPEVFDTLAMFFTKTLNKETGVPQFDAKKAATNVVEGVKNFGVW